MRLRNPILIGIVVIILALAAGLVAKYMISGASGAQVNEMDPAQFWKEYTANPNNYMFIDVRNASDYDTAHAEGSINIPIADLATEYTDLPRSGKEIALTCGDGRLAAVAYGYLSSLGFTNLIHIQGGLKNWITEGLPVEGTDVASSTPAS